MDQQTNDSSVPRRLRRRADDRVLGGVCGGLADYTGVDAIFFRVAFIVLGIAGASGVLLYVVAWLFIPDQHEARGLGAAGTGRLRGRSVLAVAILVIGGLLFVEFTQLGELEWNLVWAMALIAIGYVLLRDEPVATPTASPPGTPEMAPGAPVLEAPVPRARRPRSPLGFMTLGAAFVVLAIAAMLTASGALTLDAGQFVALAVLTLGIGLLVGAWWGRARLLAALALLLVPVMVVGTMIDVPLRGTVSGNYLAVRDLDLREEYNLLAGSLTLDFSRYRFEEEPVEVDVSFVAGNVEVYVPPGVDVTVKGEVDLGVADIFGDGYEGRDLAFADRYQRKGLTEGTLVLNVDGGLGSFDTTWADWAEHDKRRKLRRAERERRKDQRGDARDRREGKKDGRVRDRK